MSSDHSVQPGAGVQTTGIDKYLDSATVGRSQSCVEDATLTGCSSRGRPTLSSSRQWSVEPVTICWFRQPVCGIVWVVYDIVGLRVQSSPRLIGVVLLISPAACIGSEGFGILEVRVTVSTGSRKLRRV